MQELDTNVVKILVQLKVHDNVSNNFEFCQVTIPFFQRCVTFHPTPDPPNGHRRCSH